MSERRIIILGWEKFQHKDVWRKSGGKPPWIKNYTALLHNDSYVNLSRSQRGLLHGLWLMYASNGGDAIGETQARRMLCLSDADAKYLRRHLDSLSDAGFIEIQAHLTRKSLAPRVEESREEKDTNKDHEETNGADALLDEPVIRFAWEGVLRDI